MICNWIVQHVSDCDIGHASDSNNTKIVFILFWTLNDEIAGLLFLNHFVVISLQNVNVFKLIAAKTVCVKIVIRMFNDGSPQNFFLGT